jgi:hypothetical protein
MGDKTVTGETLGWSAGFDSWNHWARFAGLLVLAICILTAAVLLIVARIFDTNVDVLWKDNSLTFHQRHRDTSVLLLPSNQCWVNTGVLVDPGTTISVHATGRANLAIHRVVESAKAKQPPRHPWGGPDGAKPVDSIGNDKDKQAYLIDKDRPYGALLACFVAEDGREPGKDYPRPEHIQLVGQGVELRNIFVNPRKLWLTVNDEVFFTEDNDLSKSRARQAFVSTVEKIRVHHPEFSECEAVRHYNDLVKSWDVVAADQNHYWDISFDNNVGDYLVSIEPGAGPATAVNPAKILPDNGVVPMVMVIIAACFLWCFFLFTLTAKYEGATTNLDSQFLTRLTHLAVFACVEIFLFSVCVWLWPLRGYRLMFCIFGLLCLLPYGVLFYAANLKYTWQGATAVRSTSVAFALLVFVIWGVIFLLR